MTHSRTAPRLAFWFATLLAATACTPDPVPVSMRSATYELVRVNGVRVRRTTAEPVPKNSKLDQLDCQDKVADGVLTISDNGRAFQYRSEWRDCSGALLVTEANEGFIEASGGTLRLRIEGGSAGGKFKGEYDDTSLTIYDLGGRLSFRRRPKSAP